MWPFEKRYKAVATEEEEHTVEIDSLALASKSQWKQRRSWHTTVCLFFLLLLLSAAGLFMYHHSRTYTATDSSGSPISNTTDSDVAAGPFVHDAALSACPLRREWRTLSNTEQQLYIASVRCLLSLPSILHSNMTRYDDYPFIHSHVGYYTHHSAPFLPWHRYFLHIYESTLRSECGYTGSLTYWDWTLDSSDLAHSPVFSPTTGFGGDGDLGGALTVGVSGRCVVDGPFSDIEAAYYDTKPLPHCLSRGFHDDTGALGQMDGHDISPDAIEEVLQSRDYETFVTQLESKVHDAIPFGVGGDFETFTAPYDPLFFLHHTQLDRLWWLWQSRDPERRLSEYSGHKHKHSIELAQLTDDIKMQGFAPTVKVEQVMDIEEDFLCYQY